MVARVSSGGIDPVSDRILTRRFSILWLVGFSSYASVYLLIPVLPLYLQQRGMTPTAIGSLLGLMSLAALFTRPFSGWLSDGLGRKPLITAGLAGLLVFTLGLPFIAGALVFAILRLISGVGWGCLTSNANTLAGEMAPPGRQGEAIGHYTMAGSVAFAGAPAVGLFLIHRYGYHAAFWAAAGLTTLALVLSAFLERRPPTPLRPFSAGNLITWNAVGPAAVLMLHAMTYGGLITFLALLILAFATARWHMLGSALLFSFSMGFVQPPSLAWGLDLSGGQRGVAMATMVAAQDMGIAVGGAVLGFIGTQAGFGALFGAAAGVSLVALLGLATLARRGRVTGAPAVVVPRVAE